MHMMAMLEISNLQVRTGDQPILRGVDLSIGKGEVHCIMGPNGSGKSTLASVLAGQESYEITDGNVTFNGRNLLAMAPEERAHAGLFLAFQYPVEIPGLSVTEFLRSSLNAIRKSRDEREFEPLEFIHYAKDRAEVVHIDQSLLKRSVNEGFSGGEKKRFEIYQMAMLEPRLAILDETDSGLDIDALRIVADGVNAMRDGERSFLLITHYQRLLNYIVPDVVHVLVDGVIVRRGGVELATALEESGYAGLEAATSA